MPNKNKYKRGGKKWGDSKLSPQMRGYLITCSATGKGEELGARDAIDLLQDFAPPPPPPPLSVRSETLDADGRETNTGTKSGGSEAGPAVDVEDNGDCDSASPSLGGDSSATTTAAAEAAEEDDIEAELAALKAEFKKPPAGVPKAKPRFASTATGCRGIRFIRNNELHHVDTVGKIMANVLETGEVRSRIVQRLVPVTHSCKAHMKDVGIGAKQAVAATLGVEGGAATRYSIMCKVRNNSSITDREIVDEVVRVLKEESPQHIYDRRQPTLVLVIEVLKSVCCMAMVPNFYKYAEYNMGKLAKAKRLHDEKGAPLPGDKPPQSDRYSSSGGGGGGKGGKKRAAADDAEGDGSRSKDPPVKSAYHIAMGF